MTAIVTMTPGLRASATFLYRPQTQLFSIARIQTPVQLLVIKTKVEHVLIFATLVRHSIFIQRSSTVQNSLSTV